MLNKLKEIKVSNTVIVFLSLAIVIIFLAAGYITYRNYKSSQVKNFENITPDDSQKIYKTVQGQQPIILMDPKNGSVSGTVTAISSTDITVKEDDGSSQTFQFAPLLIVAPYPTPGKVMIISHDTKNIKVGVKVDLTFDTPNSSTDPQNKIKLVKGIIYK